MWIERLRVVNLKSIADSGELELSRGMNILVGPNNAGKSTLLKAMYRLQNPMATIPEDVRQATVGAAISIGFRNFQIANKFSIDAINYGVNAATVELTQTFGARTGTVLRLAGISGGERSIDDISGKEPSNFIYPYLSKRKVYNLEQTVNINVAATIQDDLRNLVAKIDEIRDPQHPAHVEFSSACRGVLGFEVSTFPSEGGKKAGLITGMHDRVSIDSMGEGTAQLLGLIVRLCVANQQLFLIEEIENDIHPKALKELLRLIVAKSATNQFVLSTHSNIVTKYLGAEPDSRIFHVSMEIVNRLPTTSIQAVGSDPHSRRAVLEELGYEATDLDAWQGYIFFEESSAERIVREHLIRWFTPKLTGKVRTVAAVGASQVAPKFEDLNRLFLFTHLEPMYKNRAWVVTDADAAGVDAVTKLRERFDSTWDPSHFRTWSVEDFELFYPESFQERVTEVLKTKDKGALRDAKKALLEEVLVWIKEDDARAKAEFAASAKEVIEFLREIESKLSSGVAFSTAGVRTGP